MTQGHHRNRRVEDLLRLTGLEAQAVEQITDDRLTEEIDFTYANRQIRQYRRESLKKLKGLVEKI